MSIEINAMEKKTLTSPNISKRYLRVDDMAFTIKMSEMDTELIAKAAGALYRLSKIKLIHKERFEDYMKHIYKVPGTNKQVIKKFVRVGEGVSIYSIGRNRFIEMARAAGAVYKINGGTSGTVLISLEIFDEYMEQFREEPRDMRRPLWNGNKERGD